MEGKRLPHTRSRADYGGGTPNDNPAKNTRLSSAADATTKNLSYCFYKMGEVFWKKVSSGLYDKHCVEFIVQLITSCRRTKQSKKNYAPNCVKCTHNSPTILLMTKKLQHKVVKGLPSPSQWGCCREMTSMRLLCLDRSVLCSFRYPRGKGQFE